MAKKLSEVWKARSQILEGIMNNIFKKDTVEAVAKDRLEICNTCEHKVIDGKGCLCPGVSVCCKLCGCTLSWKVRSMSEACDEGKWEAILTEEEEQELKDKFNLKDEE